MKKTMLEMYKKVKTKALENRAKTLYITLVVAALIYFFLGGKNTTYEIKSQNTSAEHEQNIQKWKSDNLKNSAQELGIPIVKGAVSYHKLMLQNGMSFQDVRTKKITKIEGVPAAGIMKSGFLHSDGNYYFLNYVDSVGSYYKIINENDEGVAK
ncbi:MAG: hypothetical protein Q7S59_10075 [Sulfurimonas sp.]|nr:hypothetical protein [Sulfurimonas sp.]